MAQYKYSTYFQTSTAAVFDDVHQPGSAAPQSGIYRCNGCNGELVVQQDSPLPDGGRHRHDAMCGPVAWKLIAHADQGLDAALPVEDRAMQSTEADQVA